MRHLQHCTLSYNMSCFQGMYMFTITDLQQKDIEEKQGLLIQHKKGRLQIEQQVKILLQFTLPSFKMNGRVVYIRQRVQNNML